MPVEQEAAQYRAHARSYYTPPGPSRDPWGPYIKEASRRFDVPDPWIRAVIQQESGGREFVNGQFVTSLPGAMGLMQLMPPTYDDMRNQYSLGTDPYDPHDNILAGTAYIRQMYDIYGSPGFLAAYNTGPGRLDDFLTHNRALPHETRRYVASVGPQIAGIYPNSRSQADLLVMNHALGGGVAIASIQDPAETRSVRMAWARKRDHDSGADQPMQVAEAPGLAPSATRYQPAWQPWHPVAARVRPDTGPSISHAWAGRLAVASPLPVAASPAASVRTAATQSRHFRLIEPVMAATVSAMHWPGVAAGPHDWAIQVGAFGTVSQASQAVGTARVRVHGLLPEVHTEIAGIQSGRGSHIYRARLTGLSRGDAMQACERLSRGRSECMVVSPDARS